MKIKNLFEMLGFKGKPKHYPYEIVEFNLNPTSVKYAQWKHPRESRKIIDNDLINGYREYISEGDFCVDVGAHSGDTSLPIALAAGKSGCVLALEPNSFVYPCLEKVARANSHVANIKTMLAAAGQEEGFMEFEYSDSGFCNGGRHENISALRHGHMFKQTVFTVNLEKELRTDFADYLPRFRFLKTDAEGYDLYILKSLENLIREYRPVIKSEVFKKTDLRYRTEFLEFFEKANYQVFKVEQEPLSRGVELKRENLDVGSHFDILALPN